MQQILVDIVVLLAVAFVARMIYRNVTASRRAKQEAACPGCGACAASQNGTPVDPSATK
mgnify:CR=1 FL=1